MWYLLVAIVAFCPTASTLSASGVSRSLSGIASKFKNSITYGKPLERAADLAGYSYAALGTYWRSNTLAAFSQMRRGEIEEAMETYNLAAATLGVFDLGQGVAYPIADKIINKIVLKHQNDFRNTINAFKELNTAMQTDVLDPATRVGTSSKLKANILKIRKKISNSFAGEVTKGLVRKFKNTQIYGDLVQQLNGIKVSVKAAKWTSVLTGPVLDSATVAINIWQLVEAVKSNNPVGIAVSSLGIASGLAGIVGFTVGALATAGTTLASVAGPVGAIIGAVLGIASIFVEWIAGSNPYGRIEADLNYLSQLATKSKEQLELNVKNVESLVPSRENAEFSWVFELNQGLALPQIKGLVKRYRQVTFDLTKQQPTQHDGYWVMGSRRSFDKEKYDDSIWWDPRGIVDLGYEWYGKKITPKFNGVTLFYDTNLLDKKNGAKIKSCNIKTFVNEADNFADNVIFGEMRNVETWEMMPSKINTGGGDDVIMFNGIWAKPWAFGNGRVYDTSFRDLTVHTAAGNGQGEANILSFEGMSTKTNYGIEVSGIYYDFRYGGCAVLFGDRSRKYENTIDGINMFVGSPFRSDEIRFVTNGEAIVRETKGNNRYNLFTNNYEVWGPFKITIDDQSETPGTLSIDVCPICWEQHKIKSTDLVYSQETRTLLIYGINAQRRAGGRWQIRGRIFFNRRKEGEHRIQLGAFSKLLSELPSKFSPPEKKDRINSQSMQYYFDRNIEMSTCEAADVYLNTPDFQEGYYWFDVLYTKLTKDSMIMTTDFVNKCIKRGRVNVMLEHKRIGAFKQHNWWYLVMTPGSHGTSVDCPVRFMQVQINDMDLFKEQLDTGGKRLIVDLWRDLRKTPVNVTHEMLQQDNRKDFALQGTFVPNDNIPRVAVLQSPMTDLASYVVQSEIGFSKTPVIIKQNLVEYAKSRNRKLELKKVNGKWAIQIISKSTGRATHTVTLRNVEKIEYEPSDGSLRQPIVVEFQNDGFNTRVDDMITSLDLIPEIEKEVARSMKYNRNYNGKWVTDCERKRG